MIEESNMLGLFPVPILYDYESGYEFTSEELNYINSYKVHRPNSNFNTNQFSVGSHVLDHGSMVNMKSFLQKYLDRYTKDFLKIKQDFYITHTWFTKNNFGEFHQPHSHPNSIISGLLYVSAGPDMGNITFHRHPSINTLTNSFAFTYDYSELNKHNSDSWWLEVKTGTVILFPSSLDHSVEENKTNNTRICIGFNSFVRGSFGYQYDYTDITLK